MSAPPRRVVLIFALAAGSSLLAACDRDNLADLRQWVSTVEARPGKPIRAVPAPEPYPTFVWPDEKMRSPFLPVSKPGVGGVRPDLVRKKEYLEQFPLDALKLVGEVSLGGSTYALIIDPHGLVSRATIGNYLGQNNGQIVAVTPSAIEIREIVPDGSGGWAERPASLSLGSQSGG